MSTWCIHRLRYQICQTYTHIYGIFSIGFWAIGCLWKGGQKDSDAEGKCVSTIWQTVLTPQQRPKICSSKQWWVWCNSVCMLCIRYYEISLSSNILFLLTVRFPCLIHSARLNDSTWQSMTEFVFTCMSRRGLHILYTFSILFTRC